MLHLHWERLGSLLWNWEVEETLLPHNHELYSGSQATKNMLLKPGSCLCPLAEMLAMTANPVSLRDSSAHFVLTL